MRGKHIHNNAVNNYQKDKTTTLRISSQNDNLLYHNLTKKKNLCTLVKENGELEIYNSLDEAINFPSNLNTPQEISNIQFRSENTRRFKAILTLYDRDFFIHLGDDVKIGYNSTTLNFNYSKTNPHYVYEFYNQCWDKPMKSRSFTYTAEYEPWPFTCTHYLVIYEGYFCNGQSLVYEKTMSTQGNRFTISESQLSRIGWANRNIESIRVMI